MIGKDIANETEEDITTEADAPETDETETAVTENEAGDMTKASEISWKKWFLIMGIVTIVLVAVFFISIYFLFVYGSQKVVKEAAEIYINGDGSDLTELSCPDYVAYFNETYTYSDIDDTNQNYIDTFREETEDRVGELTDVHVDIGGIYTISNLSELKDDFAAYGVTDIEKYKQVNMTWEISGEDGSVSISVTAFVMKYAGEYYLDYMSFDWQE